MGVPLRRLSASQRVGLDVGTLDGKVLEVYGIVPQSMVADHNSSAEDGEKILPGSFIVDVNGNPYDPPAMLRELQREEVLNLLIARARTWRVTINKGDDSLGLKLAYESKGVAVAITRVVDGAVQKFNETAPESLKIEARDRI